ncbi:hypothetical protein PYJP_18880 [Pyrofollis japonicus]|uniref:hypothetical protein n=1 Tax=Pyrofollis japonicus TaxID=3060460 RepID=UPI00295B81A4|nr:hypothetical protein [Pyrofollis japonicus]BEP18536.1 hypothetical protein PYJP_18880 [Pyrofollis japonicus]
MQSTDSVSFSEIRRALREKGVCSKSGVVEESATCSLIYCDGGDGILIAVFIEGEWVYAKIVAEGSVKPYMWHCNELLYTPYGLYVFTKNDIMKLVERIKDKKQWVLGQLRLVLERLAEVEE